MSGCNAKRSGLGAAAVRFWLALAQSAAGRPSLALTHPVGKLSCGRFISPSPPERLPGDQAISGMTRPSPERRDRAVAELCEHFSSGHIELDELEHRLAVVEHAESEAELAELVVDLPALPSTLPALVEPPAPRGWALAVLGGSSRKGVWRPPRRLNALAVMGGVELDFRDAQLAGGVTEVTAVAVMGGIDIVVPPGLPLTVSGLGIMGAVDHVEHDAGVRDPNMPRVHVRALAVMGAVDVKVRASKKVEAILSQRDERRT